MARFQARLDHLFRTVQAPDGGEYTYRQVAAGVERLVGHKTSASYLQVLRTGGRANPSIKHLYGLCAFFGVPIEYFFDEDVAQHVDGQLELAASLRSPAVRQLAIRATGLSAEALATLTQMVEHVRQLEGLDTEATRLAEPAVARPAANRQRRGRHHRVRGGGAASEEETTPSESS